MRLLPLQGMNTNLYSVAGKRCQPTGCERSVNLSGESSSLGSTCLHGEGAERQALYMTARLAALKPYDMRHTHTHSTQDVPPPADHRHDATIRTLRGTRWTTRYDRTLQSLRTAERLRSSYRLEAHAARSGGFAASAQAPQSPMQGSTISAWEYARV